MKKDYMKPEANEVVMKVSENIARSAYIGTANDSFGIYYRPEGDDQYIATTQVKRSNTGNADFDMFADLMKAFAHKVADVCSYDPDDI